VKAAVFHGVRQISIDTLPTPKPALHEVVVRVRACGICGTDQHIYHGKPGSAEVLPPVVLGHELAGDVVDVGDGVSHLHAGDRVSIDPNLYCDTCKYCRTGRKHLCVHLRAVGVTRDGGMAEFCSVPAANAYKLPNTMDYVQGAMVEPLGCCLHGMDRIHVDSTDRVAIVGGGFIGLLMLQLVKKFNPRWLTLIEPDEAKRRMGSQFGANEVMVPSEAREVRDSFDVVVECVGRGETMRTAIDLAARGGRVLLFGVANPETTVDLHPFAVFHKELTICGSFINPHTQQRAIDLLEQGAIEIEPLISHRMTLFNIPQVMANYPKLGVIKAVMEM
jgi:L-iditol 2-dehydrogenase